MPRPRSLTNHTPDNSFLAALPPDVHSAVDGQLERLRLPGRTSIYQLGGRIDHVYFPIDAVISVVSVMQDGAQIEAITVGREGMTGAAALLDGTNVSTLLTWCQVAGESYRMPFDTFTGLAQRYPALKTLVQRFAAAQFDVMAQSIACNRLHYVTERCARWLLMTEDRVGRSEFQLTHESLAAMLGVRRAGVSIAAAGLQQAGYIRYSRGRCSIVDRPGLVGVACECYEAINDAYERRRFPAS